jgi:hypothetical protein
MPLSISFPIRYQEVSHTKRFDAIGLQDKGEKTKQSDQSDISKSFENIYKNSNAGLDRSKPALRKKFIEVLIALATGRSNIYNPTDVNRI